MSERVIVPHWPDLPPFIGALTTLRTGGVSLAPYDDGAGSGTGGFNLATHVGDQIDHVMENRHLLAHYLPSEPQWLSQVHGTTVVRLDEKSSDTDNPTADASFTTQTNVICAVQTADCLPVLLCDATTKVVAAVHAGWRGLASGVIENTLAKMQDCGAKSDNVMAWLGPAIGPLQFEVGEEVKDQFMAIDLSASAAFKAREGQRGKFLADICLLAELRLLKAGVNKIARGNFCTVSQANRFYSYRRDGVTGRMASLIWIKH